MLWMRQTSNFYLTWDWSQRKWKRQNSNRKTVCLKTTLQKSFIVLTFSPAHIQYIYKISLLASHLLIFLLFFLICTLQKKKSCVECQWQINERKYSLCFLFLAFFALDVSPFVFLPSSFYLKTENTNQQSACVCSGCVVKKERNMKIKLLWSWEKLGVDAARASGKWNKSKNKRSDWRTNKVIALEKILCIWERVRCYRKRTKPGL